MIQLQFFWENAHFALSLFTALVFFAACWLYFDAWLLRKDTKDGLKVIGLFLICCSFIVHATHIEQTILLNPLLGTDMIILVSSILKVIGYIMLIIGLAADPLQKRPGEEVASPAPEQKVAAAAAIPTGILSLPILPIMQPLLCLSAAVLYFRRSTTGLENHLKPVALAFFVLSLHDLLDLAVLFRNTDNVGLFNLVAPFGIIWIIQHLLLLVAMLILGRWLAAYLIKRIQSQLFMIFTVLTLSIFLLTTVSFTGLLLRTLESNALAHLSIDVNVLSYSIDSKKAETLSDAQVLAINPDIKNAVLQNNTTRLKDIAAAALLSKKESSLVIVTTNGAVLARGEDPERIGDTLSGDPLLRRAAAGTSASSVSTRQGVLAPTVSVKSVAPIMDQGAVLGAVFAESDIDNAFVDGVKKATKLDASIYADNIRSATTFLSLDKKSRWVGIREETPTIKKIVLSEGKPYTGSVNILNVPYLAAFVPLNDIDNNPVGMLFVGRPQFEILQTAGQSIEITFIVSAILLVLSIIPAFLVARYISSQIR